MIPLNAQSTWMEPAKSIYEELLALDRDFDAVLSFCMAFPAADFAECAPMVWGYGELAAQAVQRLGDRVAEPTQWRLTTLDAAEAVTKAMALAAHSGKPVVMADTQDNPGAGGDSNTTGLLHALLQQGAGRRFPGQVALGLMFDPEAAAMAAAAGVGATISTTLGKAVPTFTGQLSDTPVRGAFKVRAVHEGTVTLKGQMMTGLAVHLGPCACLEIEGVLVAVASGKKQMLDRELFRMVGIEPEAMKIIVVKSSNHFRADFTPLVANAATDILIAKAAGPMAADPADLPWKICPVHPAQALEPFPVPALEYPMTPSAPSSDLADCTATELLQLYKAGEASPVQATAAVLARIDTLNPTVNAFCLVAHESAMQTARNSEARWQRFRNKGEPCGELDGVPVSIKDLILTRGMPTLRGSHTVDAKQPWDVDAPVTARLREAGAVILGKTNTPEFGCKGETNSPRSGITRNPWDLSKTPGGSSGGAAAAIAAGMGPLAMGTDGAGSVRIPAAFCGNFGLKPSFGRVPAYPLSPFGSVAHLGPHSRSVRDAALMMNVLKKPDDRDWTSLPPDPSDYLQGLEDGVRGLRIAWSPTLGYAKNVHPEVARSVAQAVAQLVELGAHVELIDPGFEDPLEITTGLWFAGAWTVWNTLSAEQQALTDPDLRAEALLVKPARLSCNACICGVAL